MRIVRSSRGCRPRFKKITLTAVACLLALSSSFAVAVIGPSNAAKALPGDVTWQETGPTTLIGDQMNWQYVASSADGSKLVTLTDGGYIYTSTNSGISWTERTSAGQRHWASVSSSSDGVRFAAVAADTISTLPQTPVSPGLSAQVLA